MEKCITVLNHKGGVGKTTTVINVGTALERLGKKVLLVDLDPQSNLTIHCGKNPEIERNIYKALKKEYPLPISNVRGNLDIVCSTLDLSVAELELSSEAGREYLVKELLDPVRKDYDFILFDCPPALTFLTMNALSASQEAIIPVELQSFAIMGMQRIFDLMKLIQKRINPSLADYKILITRQDKRKAIQRESLEYLQKKYPGKLFNTNIGSNVKVEESQFARTDIFSYNEKSTAALEYMEVAKELLHQK